MNVLEPRKRCAHGPRSSVGVLLWLIGSFVARSGTAASAAVGASRGGARAVGPADSAVQRAAGWLPKVEGATPGWLAAAAGTGARRKLLGPATGANNYTGVVWCGATYLLH